MKKLKARKDAIVARAGVEKSLRSLTNCEVIEGHARFTAPHTVSVNGKTLISGGSSSTWEAARDSSRPECAIFHQFVHDGRRFRAAAPFDSRGSAVGLEFAQMYRRFGSEVTVIEQAPRLLPHEDEDISAAVLDILAKEDIQVALNAHNVAVKATDQGLNVHNFTGTHLLVAAGRVPNTDDLGLDAAGIATDERGYIHVDEDCATSARGVWALGDCNGRGGFTHTSYNDYEIVAANLLDKDSRRISDRIYCSAVYIDPRWHAPE